MLAPLHWYSVIELKIGAQILRSQWLRNTAQAIEAGDANTIRIPSGFGTSAFCPRPFIEIITV